MLGTTMGWGTFLPHVSVPWCRGWGLASWSGDGCAGGVEGLQGFLSFTWVWVSGRTPVRETSAPLMVRPIAPGGLGPIPCIL